MNCEDLAILVIVLLAAPLVVWAAHFLGLLKVRIP